MGAERWDRIAEQVVGKTKGECVKRYKEIVAALKAKKEAAAAWLDESERVACVHSQPGRGTRPALARSTGPEYPQRRAKVLSPRLGASPPL